MFGGVPEVLRPHLPSFRHVLIDLARVEDAELSTDIRFRACLKALKYIFCTDLAERLEVLLAEAPLLESADVILILGYIDRGPIPVSRAVIRNALRRLIPNRENEIMGHFTQEFFEDGKAQGIQLGRVEGEARSLIRVLERRFGRLSSDCCERILSADVATLDSWFERAFDAPDVASLLDSLSAPGTLSD